MSLLHATWLRNPGDLSEPPSSALFLWADNWQLAAAKERNFEWTSSDSTAVVFFKYLQRLSINSSFKWLH